MYLFINYTMKKKILVTLVDEVSKSLLFCCAIYQSLVMIVFMSISIAMPVCCASVWEESVPLVRHPDNCLTSVWEHGKVAVVRHPDTSCPATIIQVYSLIC